MGNCPKCGVALKEGEKYCTGCGAIIEAHESSIAQPMAAYNLPPEKKANKGLIIGIIAIIFIVITALIAVVILSSGVLFGESSGGDSRLVGTWEYEIMGQSIQYLFNSDGTLEVGFDYVGYLQEVGTWNSNGNKLCMKLSAYSIEGMGTSGEQCFTYSISSDGNTLTLTQNGTSMVFTKV